MMLMMLMAEQCRTRLQNLSCEFIPPSLPASVHVSRARSSASAAPLDDEVDGDDDENLQRPRASRAANQPESNSDSSSSSSSSTSESNSSADGDSDDGYPAEIMGMPLKRVAHSGDTDFGLRVWCRNPDHPGCNKYKSVKLNTSQFGKHSAVYAWETWLASSFDMEFRPHKEWQPTPAQIRKYLESTPNN